MIGVGKGDVVVQVQVESLPKKKRYLSPEEAPQLCLTAYAVLAQKLGIATKPWKRVSAP
jgi:hypothetical protein